MKTLLYLTIIVWLRFGFRRKHFSV